jgi:hypothetical protein
MLAVLQDTDRLEMHFMKTMREKAEVETDKRHKLDISMLIQ